MGTHAVELRDVTKTFGTHVAVDALSLDVPAGCIYGFIGPNGSGKTTTLRMIVNILLPDRGDIRLFGARPAGPCSQRIGYLPEERGLYKKMKVRDVLRFYGKLKEAAEVNRTVDGWLERLGLAEWADKPVEALSKGMSQKVQFIAAVVCRPELLILDEPFTGLDPVAADELGRAITELRAQGTTIILSTHDMNVAESMGDFIFMIYRGKKVLDGTLASIQDRYGTDLVRVRLEDGGSLPELPGVVQRAQQGPWHELRLAAGANSQAVLAALATGARVRHFELARPSLHDIFVRIARPEAEEVGHA